MAVFIKSMSALATGARAGPVTVPEMICPGDTVKLIVVSLLMGTFNLSIGTRPSAKSGSILILKVPCGMRT